MVTGAGSARSRTGPALVPFPCDEGLPLAPSFGPFCPAFWSRTRRASLSTAGEWSKGHPGLLHFLLGVSGNEAGLLPVRRLRWSLPGASADGLLLLLEPFELPTAYPYRYS